MDLRLFAAWLTVVLHAIWGLTVKAALVVDESFNYGGVSNSLAGLNGGTGFWGTWADDGGIGTFNYVPTGQTFGTLATTGSAAQVGTLSNVAPYFKAEISRQFDLDANIAGTAYRSYLFSIPCFSSSRDSLAGLFGETNIKSAGLRGSPDNFAQIPKMRALTTFV